MSWAEPVLTAVQPPAILLSGRPGDLGVAVWWWRRRRDGVDRRTGTSRSSPFRRISPVVGEHCLAMTASCHATPRCARVAETERLTIAPGILVQPCRVVATRIWTRSAADHHALESPLDLGHVDLPTPNGHNSPITAVVVNSGTIITILAETAVPAGRRCRH